MWTIFKVFIELVTILLLFYVARQKMQGKNTQWESKEKKGKEKE